MDDGPKVKAYEDCCASTIESITAAYAIVVCSSRSSYLPTSILTLVGDYSTASRVSYHT